MCALEQSLWQKRRVRLVVRSTVIEILRRNGSEVSGQDGKADMFLILKR